MGRRCRLAAPSPSGSGSEAGGRTAEPTAAKGGGRAGGERRGASRQLPLGGGRPAGPRLGGCMPRRWLPAAGAQEGDVSWEGGDVPVGEGGERPAESIR